MRNILILAFSALALLAIAMAGNASAQTIDPFPTMSSTRWVEPTPQATPTWTDKTNAVYLPFVSR